MLTKPNILRLVFFFVVFAAALYYPVHQVISYETPRTPPREYRFRVVAAKLNKQELRPRVSGRWKWVDYIFPRAEKPNKLRLDLRAPVGGTDVPKLNFVYYPMSAKLAEETDLRLRNPAQMATAELVIKRYPNGRCRLGKLFIDGRPVEEPARVGVSAK